MKVQCSCGAKYAFDVTPDMAAAPIRFICPACGVDSSEYVNARIRQELGVTSQTKAASAESGSARPAEKSPVLRLSSASPPASRQTTSEVSQSGSDENVAPESEGQHRCMKHGGEMAVERCRI